MARSCVEYSKKQVLPSSILENEEFVEYFNLAAAALLRCGFEDNNSDLNAYTPIYKPLVEIK